METINKINYGKAFQLFVSKDELRPDMLTPFKQDNKYFATDAMAIIFIPIEEVEYNTHIETYYHEADCPLCEGAGSITKTDAKPTGKTIPNPSQKYKMQGTGFFYWQLKRLVDV